jgi:hypothetical protein
MALWKTKEVYYKCTNFLYLKVDTVDAMTKQRCSSQNPLIRAMPLTHLHSNKRHGFTISWNKIHNSSLQS